MHRARPLLLAIAFTASLGSVASAQGVLVLNGRAIGLLLRPRVQKELRLDKDQTAKAVAANDAAQAKLKELPQKIKDLEKTAREKARDEAYQHITDDFKKEISGFLSPEQMKRLREITIQRIQGEAFRDPEIREELKLSEEQKKKIDMSLRKKQEKIGPIVARIGDPKTRQQASEEARVLEHELIEAITTVLTKEQKEQWRKMHGEPTNAG